MNTVVQQEVMILENGHTTKGVTLTREITMRHGHARTAHNMSSSSLRKKSELALVSKVQWCLLRNLLINFQEVVLGTKLSILFLAIPFAFVAEFCRFGRPWVFALSLLGLTPLAERVSFLTEQIAYHTGPTVGGLLNATFGNVTELIIAIFALRNNKIDVLKYSLLGSVLSNLLLVLGTSLFCGGLAYTRVEQKFDRKQADVNSLMLLLAFLCHLLPLLLRYSGTSATPSIDSSLQFSRAASIVMLIAYLSYLVFQLWTHRQLFEAEDEEDDNDNVTETAEIGFWSGVAWLAGLTALIAILSQFVVDTIEGASDSFSLSVSFLSIILLPIVGNATEHAGAIIFALKNKLDISLGVALGSAVQISMFVVPLCVVIAWMMGIKMDLDFNLLETGSLALAILIPCFALQDGTSHYMKGLVLLFCYIIIGASFFVQRTPFNRAGVPNTILKPTTESAQIA